jgi:restriction endonuclease
MVPPIPIRRFFPVAEGELWHHWLHHVEKASGRDLRLVGLVMWKRFLGEGSGAQGMTQDTLSGALQKTWVKSGSMSGREFEHFMADLLRAACYKVDVLGGAGDQGVDLLVKEGRKLLAVQCT